MPTLPIGRLKLSVEKIAGCAGFCFRSVTAIACEVKVFRGVRRRLLRLADLT